MYFYRFWSLFFKFIIELVIIFINFFDLWVHHFILHISFEISSHFWLCQPRLLLLLIWGWTIKGTSWFTHFRIFRLLNITFENITFHLLLLLLLLLLKLFIIVLSICEFIVILSLLWVLFLLRGKRIIFLLILIA